MVGAGRRERGEEERGGREWMQEEERKGLRKARVRVRRGECCLWKGMKEI